jgi:hypothetical protein
LPRWIDDLAKEGQCRGSESVVDTLIPEHLRKVTLTSMAGTMRRRGFGEKAMLAALLIENADRCQPRLDDKEVVTIVKSIARYAPSSAGPRPTNDLTTFDAHRLPPLQRPAGVRVPPLLDPRCATQRLGNGPETDVYSAA